ncbi:PIG-L family deacetylase [Leucobacter tardus]|uniref:PIG-L family deacetylase n=1 Tax=Leucobacter tardus TaxID=501483 RepID=A0A939TQA0_9MICO|nr:PIG-L family deacetylase [Leucobacter tardus]MBO2988737.1 PIG-L family deacetylase [Leucobacter tardus]
MIEDPKHWFEGVPRVLFVHAHPDDETIITGGTLAALAESGQEPLLVTLSRGEQGEAVPGTVADVDPQGLAAHRMTELAGALAALGIDRHVFLGAGPARAEGLPPRIYEDSGMMWGADGRATAAAEADDEALTAAPVMEVLNDLVAAAHDAGAGAIVSYDNGGGYGHPDHVLAHRAARAVAHALELPFWEAVSSADARAESAVEAYDISPWLDRKVAALRAHASQVTVDGDELVHVGGQRQAIDAVERFRRVIA